MRQTTRVGKETNQVHIFYTFTKVVVWNGNVFYLTAPIPISPKFCCPPNKGVNDFAFFVGT